MSTEATFTNAAIALQALGAGFGGAADSAAAEAGAYRQEAAARVQVANNALSQAAAIGASLNRQGASGGGYSRANYRTAMARIRAYNAGASMLQKAQPLGPWAGVSAFSKSVYDNSDKINELLQSLK